MDSSLVAIHVLGLSWSILQEVGSMKKSAPGEQNTKTVVATAIVVVIVFLY